MPSDEPRRLRGLLALAALLAALAADSASHAADDAGLTAGTGRGSIDPAATAFPIRNGTDSPLIGIHDPLEARALVVQQPTSKAILVVLDTIVVPDEFYEKVVGVLATRYSTPRDHIWIAATHTHTVPWTMENGYREIVVAGILSAVAQAARRLEPVRVGIGRGAAYINMNRDERTPTGFILGQDPEGASDKSVRVAAFYRADGTPLAILANYAVHAVSLYSSDTAGDRSAYVSADIPGVVNRFVDAHYGPANTETLWTSGAAGEQNPILMSFHAEPGSDGRVVTSDMKAAGFMVTQRLGQALALEIIRVVDRTAREPVTTPIRAAQVIAECPDKVDPALQRPLRISYLGIGPLDLIGVSGEVATLIDRHLRQGLGGRDPAVLTLTNGYSGYLPDEGSFGRGETFEVSKAHVAPGCAEQLIVEHAHALLAVGAP
jgi:neutral ceramidase